ncbi:MAG: hypothetical protein PHE18_02315 [Candidatus Omnitrophica bacterium]|nr:hypothetical protein [Candidatus Omnitrophota bacterium]
MPVFIFLFINSIVGLSAYIAVYKLFQYKGFVDALICWFVFYFSQIALTSLILGVLSQLRLSNLILLNLITLFSLWLVSRKRASSFDPRPLKNSLPALFSNKVILLALSVILSFGVVKIFINLVNPPFGWDSLNYHFTFPVEWLKNANLHTPITVFDDPSPSYYPIGASLYFFWLILPFKSVFMADLGQVPFFVLAFFAVFSISRKLSLNREFSFLAASLFFMIPNFFKQLQIAYADVMMAALFLACLNSLFLLRGEFSRRNTLSWSLSLGLMLSTKTVALPYSALLTIPFIYLTVKNINRVYLFFFSAAVVCALGGFSYIRNFIEAQNPLYPLNLSFWGREILKGPISAADYRSRFSLGDYRFVKMLFHEGLGLQTLLFVLPASFLALPIAFIKKRRGVGFFKGYLFCLPVLLFLAYRFIIPYANLRYLYPLLGLGVILAFYTADKLNLPRSSINILSAICVISSMAELAKRRELVTSAILAILIFALSLIMIIRRPRIPVKKSVLYMGIVISAVISLFVLQDYYIKNEYPRYLKMVKYSGFWPDAAKAWDWLNSNTEGDNVAYAGRPVPFPLYGTNFKNNVYYVSVNKTEPAKLHYFPDSDYAWGEDFISLHMSFEEEGNYRGGADFSTWMNNLGRRGTDYLFVYSLHQTKELAFPVEDDWARQNKVFFRPVFINDTIHIYKISKG